MRAGQIRLAFISSSSRLSREGEEKTVQPFPSTWALLFYYNWAISLKHCIWKYISSDVVLLNFKRSIFPPMYETYNYKRSLCTESWPFPLSPPYITLDRSDGVQTTAPFPSHPTWGPGIPIAWSPPLVHTLQLCIHTPHCLKEDSTPRKTLIQNMSNVSLVDHPQCIMWCLSYIIMHDVLLYKAKCELPTWLETLCRPTLFLVEQEQEQDEEEWEAWEQRWRSHCQVLLHIPPQFMRRKCYVMGENLWKANQCFLNQFHER